MKIVIKYSLIYSMIFMINGSLYGQNIDMELNNEVHKGYGYNPDISKIDFEKIKSLIDQGANPSYQAKKGVGETALHWAAMWNTRGEYLVWNALLSAKKFDINVRNSLGQTPFYLAAGNEILSNELLKKLIQEGADVTALTQKNANALHYAADKGNGRAVDFLLTDAGIKPETLKQLITQINTHGGTPYDSAMRNGHIKTAQFIKMYADLYKIPNYTAKK